MSVWWLIRFLLLQLSCVRCVVFYPGSRPGQSGHIQYQLEIGLPAQHNTITVIHMEMIISDSLQCPAT